MELVEATEKVIEVPPTQTDWFGKEDGEAFVLCHRKVADDGTATIEMQWHGSVDALLPISEDDDGKPCVDLSRLPWTLERVKDRNPNIISPRTGMYRRVG